LSSKRFYALVLEARAQHPKLLMRGLAQDVSHKPIPYLLCAFALSKTCPTIFDENGLVLSALPLGTS